jgi:hypothetical protein
VSRNKGRNKTEPMRENTKNKKNPTQQCGYTITEVVCLMVGIEFATVCSKPHGTYLTAISLLKGIFLLAGEIFLMSKDNGKKRQYKQSES